MVVQNTAAGSIILFTVVEPKMQLVYVQREILGKNYTFPIQGSYFVDGLKPTDCVFAVHPDVSIYPP